MASPAVAEPTATGDFDRDGRSDLAIGAPFDSVTGHAHAGAVNVIYGSDRGLREDPDQQFTQDTPGIIAAAEADDRFGAALAAGDFDDNGCDDLAIGVPDDSVGGADGAGAVDVLYSTRAGVRGGRKELWTQNTPGVKASPARFIGSAMRLPPGTSTTMAMTIWPSDCLAGGSTAFAPVR